ncbi:hypothetical protein CHU32_22415 [Superficieibacter electus]|uniref:Uncharacterized protein n=1 Tax=Superficieibacter electus TaxID=2022662 RepID=A0A2P5GJM3_9ENTR|nr:hypothetical protein CHU33_22880 [Superficieibacter electus]POP43976.1 hypothetical protein CHU32_22415 [Superficieibacter electus]
MRISCLGARKSPLLSVKVKMPDDAGPLNVSALCRKLGVHRSTFLSCVAAQGLKAAILYYVTE